MKVETADDIAAALLEWAFTGQHQLPQRRHNQIKSITRQARIENRESNGKRRSRFWGLGPKWGRRAA